MVRDLLVNMLYSIMRFLSWLITKILFRLDIKGRENIPEAGGFILASNHASYLDPVVLGAACSRRLNFIARHDLFLIPIFGNLISHLNTFPVRRDKADISGVKEAIHRLKQAGGLVLFPEGGRSLGGLVKRVEAGIGFIAAKSKVPVIPAFVKGSERALGRNARLIRPTKIKVRFGKAIYPNSDEIKENYEDFANRIMHEINQLSIE